MTRTQAIQTAEATQVPYRAYKMPAHKGKTWTEVKAEKRIKRNKIIKAIGIGLVILTAIAVGTKSCIG